MQKKRKMKICEERKEYSFCRCVLKWACLCLLIKGESVPEKKASYDNQQNHKLVTIKKKVRGEKVGNEEKE